MFCMLIRTVVPGGLTKRPPCSRRAPTACLALCSNRSAALLQLSKTTKALADAEECIRLRPDWDKGYFRRAAVLEALDRLDEVGAAWGGRHRGARRLCVLISAD